MYCDGDTFNLKFIAHLPYIPTLLLSVTNSATKKITHIHMPTKKFCFQFQPTTVRCNTYIITFRSSVAITFRIFWQMCLLVSAVRSTARKERRNVLRRSALFLINFLSGLHLITTWECYFLVVERVTLWSQSLWMKSDVWLWQKMEWREYFMEERKKEGCLLPFSVLFYSRWESRWFTPDPELNHLVFAYPTGKQGYSRVYASEHGINKAARARK